MTKNINRYLWNELMYFLQNTTKNSAEYSIARELLKRIDDIPFMKIDEFAYFSNVTPSTISKFCKKLGFSGFNELKDSLAQIPDDHSHISYIRNNYNREDYQDSFLQYDALLTEGIFQQLNDNTNTQILCSKISQAKTICVISPDYSSTSVISFAKTCASEGIDCFKISRKSDHDLIVELVKDTDIIIVITATGEWIADSNTLMKSLLSLDSQVYAVGSTTMSHKISSYHGLIPIVLADEYTLLDSHYNSSRFYTLFFIYLALSI